MNFVGHIHLARLDLARQGHSAGDETDDRELRFLIGSALPDIAAMGRFRLSGRPADPLIGAGVDLHHRTDDVFHRHPWFRRNSKAVAAELEAGGLSRGAARACGHVGVELLLDGRLLDEQPGLRPWVERSMSTLATPRFGLSTAVDDGNQPQWQHHLSSVSDWPLPTDYRQPAAVAERLRRILRRRPRLAFGDDQVAVVDETLSRHQPKLEAEMADLIDELSSSLAA